MRLLDAGLVMGFLAWAFAALPAEGEAAFVRRGAGIAGLTLLFAYLTLELNTATAHFVPAFRSGAVSLLWAAFALSFVISGIRGGTRGLRYAGLVLFAVVVWKIFFVDLARLGQIYRIAAFIVLGAVLLCGSFVYLKYRQRFTSEPPPLP
jgi:uncharacterized membrane protein